MYYLGMMLYMDSCICYYFYCKIQLPLPTCSLRYKSIIGRQSQHDAEQTSYGGLGRFEEEMWLLVAIVEFCKNFIWLASAIWS